MCSYEGDDEADAASLMRALVVLGFLFTIFT